MTNIRFLNDHRRTNQPTMPEEQTDTIMAIKAAAMSLHLRDFALWLIENGSPECGRAVNECAKTLDGASRMLGRDAP